MPLYATDEILGPEPPQRIDPTVQKFLPDEDLRDYRLARDPKLRQEISRLQQDLPTWHDAYQSMLYNRVSKYAESTGEILSLGEGWAAGILLKDRGQAARRRYGDELDPYYWDADGTINYDRLEQDRFVLDVERAYYKNRGKVPLDFFLKYYEDTDLLTAYPEITNVLSMDERILAVHHQAEMVKTAKAAQDAQFLAQYSGIPFTEGYQLVSKMQEIVAQAGDDMELGQRLVNEVLPSWLDEDSNAINHFFGGNAEPERKQVNYEIVKRLAEGERYDQIDASLGDKRALEQFLADAMGFIPQILNGAGWAVDSLPDNNFTRVLDGVFALQNVVTGSEDEWRERQEAMIDDLETQLTVGFGYDYLLTAGLSASDPQANFEANWERLPQVNPEEYEWLMTVAEGNESVAKAFYIDLLANALTLDTAQQEAYEQRNSLIKTQITEMEKESFSTSDKLLGLIAAYGESVEFISTAITMSLNEVLTEGAVPNVFTSDFWQEVRDADTPAGVFGLEGTLIGLGTNLFTTTFFDPANIFLAPAFGKAGATGASTARQAATMLDSPAYDYAIKETVNVVRGVRTGGAGTQLIFDRWSATGMDETIMAAMKGFKRPLEGYRSYLDDATLAATTTDVHVTFLDDLFSTHDVPMDPDAVYLAADAIENGTIQPVEFTINPNTGQWTVNHAEYGAALRDVGFDAIPVRFKIDPDLGVRTAPALQNLDDATAILVDDIATGKVERQLHEGGTVVKTDAAVVGEVQDRMTRIISDSEVVGTPDSMVQLVKSFDNKGPDGGKVYVYRYTNTELPQADTFQYIATDGPVGPGLTPKVHGGVIVNSGEIQMGLGSGVRAKGVRTMQQIWDTALEQGDNLLQYHGKSSSTSLQAIEFAKKYARHLQDERGMGNYVVAQLDETLPIFDSFKGIEFDSSVPLRDGGVGVNPKNVLSEADLYGDVDFELIKELNMRHLMMGGEAPMGRNTVTSLAVGDQFGRILKEQGGKIGDWVDSYLSKINANVRYDYSDTVARSNLNQLGVRLWASVQDSAVWDTFAARISNVYSKKGSLRLRVNEISKQSSKLLEAKNAVLREIDGFDNIAAEKLTPEQAKARSAAVKQVKEFDAQVLKLDKELAALNQDLMSYSELGTIMDEMLNEFNRKHIASNPKWAGKVDPDTGMVPWEKITGRTPNKAYNDVERVLQRARDENLTLKEAAKRELGYVPKGIEAFDSKLAGSKELLPEALAALQHKSAWVAPASPLEIMTAAHAGPEAVTSVTARITNQGIADFAHAAHMYWVMDKVFTNRTGITVATDELVRIFHQGGTRQIAKYLEDKAAGVADSVTHAMGSAAWQKLPQRWKDRLVKLKEYPTHFRMQERSFREIDGIGQDVLSYRKGRNNSEYYEAAQRQAGQFLTDRGFQKAMQGEAAFKKWYATDPEAAYFRTMEYMDTSGIRKIGPPADEVFAFYNRTMDDWMLSGVKPGQRAEAKRQWLEATMKQADIGATSAGNVQLPEWVLEGFGSVTGNAMHQQAAMRPINMVADALFQRPVNYRRGFMAEMIRESEMARLNKLFKSQGRKIVSEREIQMILERQFPGQSSWLYNTAKGEMAKILQDAGVVSETTVRQLVEERVVREIENTLYSFQMNSRAGRQVAALAPFGKPYADMVGFWGREMVSRPNLRGWINQTNWMNIDKIANNIVNQMPFNPKSVGFVSRIAATDFDLDRIDEDPVFGGLARRAGLTEMDLSPSLFLPTAGNNPLAVLIPGLGLVPTAFLHLAAQKFAPDPVKDPIGYQAWMRDISEYIPSLAYNQPQNPGQFGANLFFGGGTTAKTLRLADAFSTIATGSPLMADVFDGSWKNRIEGNRQLRLAMQDGAFWEDLNELPSELQELGLTAYLDEQLEKATDVAERGAAVDSAKEILTELNVPVRATFANEQEELDEVWISAADWMGIEIPEQYNMATPSGKGQAANEARTAFYALPGWERDALVAEHPGLAVNLVSQWKWTEQAVVSDDVDTGLPYRSGGSTTERARHQNLINKGYIQPMTAKEFATAVIGVVANAKKSTAQELYTQATRVVNEDRWSSLSPEQQEYFQGLADWAREEGELPYTTGREAWQNYGQLKTVINRYEETQGADPEKLWKIPDKFQPWGEARPGSPEQLREAYREGFLLPYISEDMKKLADSLKIDLTATPTMAYIYDATADRITQDLLENPQFANVAADYYGWLNPKSAGSQATQNFFGALLDGGGFTPDQRYEYKKVQIYIEETQRMRASGDTEWVQMREQALNKYARMIQDDAFRHVDGVGRWNDSWGRSLGAFDWTPDEPPPLVMGDRLADNASRAYVRNVVDGDTIDVSFGKRDAFGTVEVNRVRLLGINTKELGAGGEDAKLELEDRIDEAVANGTPVYIVRDPDRYGNTDLYGRVFGWLYIGNEAYYDPSTMIPRSE